MRSIITAVIIIITAFQANGQVFSENAITFGQHTFGGTARFQGIGGATTALGGDISNAANNPAGLGFIRKGYYTFTPSFDYSNADLSLFGESTTASRLNPNLNHIGLAITNGTGAGHKGTFAITFTRLNNFNKTFSYEGTNSDNSIVDFLLGQADLNIQYNDLFDQADFGFVDLFGLAYNNFLINPDYRDTACTDNLGNIVPCEDTYSSFRFESVKQSETVETKGSQNEWDFAYGGHINNRIYLGGSIGIQTLRYEEVKTYREEAVAGQFEFEDLELVEELDLRGTGVNLEFGMIIRASDRIRFGITATSPTVIQMTDLYQARLSTNYATDTLATFFQKDGFEFEVVYDNVPRRNFAETDILEAEYTIVTPYRLKGGASVFLGKKGFLSADLEYVGYKSTRFRDSQNLGLGEDIENDFISSTYKNAINVRVGGEMRIKDFRARAGFAYYGQPATDESANPQLFITAGAGYRNKNFFVDVAAVAQYNEFQYNPYSIQGAANPIATGSRSGLKLAVTLGRFF